MRKTLLALATLATLIACNKNDETHNLTLTGNVEGFKQGKLYLQKIVDTTLVTIDSVIVDGDSKFERKFNIESPELYFLNIERRNSNNLDNMLAIFVEPGVININTTLQNYYSNAKVTGSKNHDLFVEYRKLAEKYNFETNSIIAQKLLASKDNNPKKLDSLNNRADKITMMKYLVYTNFAKNHGDKEIAPYVALAEIQDINTKYLDTIAKALTPEVIKSKYGKDFTQLLESRKK